MYTKKVMNCFFNPTHAGIVSNYNARGFTGSIECGDAIELTMYINEEGIIEEAKFRSFGCTAAIASAEALVELILNKNISEVQNIKNKDIVSFLDGLPDLKLHCSVLGEDVLIDALKNYSSIKSDTDDTEIICECNVISKLSFEKTIVQCDNLCMAEIKKRLNFEFICGSCANSMYLLLAMYQEQQDTKNENHIS